MPCTIHPRDASRRHACHGCWICNTTIYIARESKTVAIAQADLFGYMLTYAGLLSIVPEAITIFAPEIASRDSISGTVWSKLDYLTYVAVAAASGVNIMKRVMFLKHMKETTKTS